MENRSRSCRCGVLSIIARTVVLGEAGLVGFGNRRLGVLGDNVNYFIYPQVRLRQALEARRWRVDAASLLRTNAADHGGESAAAPRRALSAAQRKPSLPLEPRDWPSGRRRRGRRRSNGQGCAGSRGVRILRTATSCSSAVSRTNIKAEPGLAARQWPCRRQCGPLACDSATINEAER